MEVGKLSQRKGSRRGGEAMYPHKRLLGRVGSAHHKDENEKL